MLKINRIYIVILVLLTVVLISASLFIYMDLSDHREVASLNVTTIYGDLKETSDITVNQKYNYADALGWDVTYTLGEQPSIESKFSKIKREIFKNVPTTYSYDLQLDAQPSANFDMGEKPVGDKGLSKALIEASKEMGDKEEYTKTINLSDYYDYYPISGNIEYDSYSWHWSELGEWGTYYSKHNFNQKFNEFFKIPVLKSSQYEITIYGLNSNGSFDYYTSDSSFDMMASSVFTESGFYFTFNPYTKDGELVDTSLIPGGYGIYHIGEDNDSEVEDEYTIRKFGDITMVCPLSTDYQLLDIYLSNDESQLILHREKDNQLYITFIDLATMEEVQTLNVGTMPKLNDYYGYQHVFYQEDNYIALIFKLHKLFIFEKNDANTWKVEAELSTKDIPLPFSYIDEMAYDGEKIAVYCWLDRADRDEYPDYYISKGHTYEVGKSAGNFDLVVFDKEKLLYLGTFENSLDMPQTGDDWTWLSSILDSDYFISREDGVVLGLNH